MYIGSSCLNDIKQGNHMLITKESIDPTAVYSDDFQEVPPPFPKMKAI